MDQKILNLEQIETKQVTCRFHLSEQVLKYSNKKIMCVRGTSLLLLIRPSKVQ